MAQEAEINCAQALAKIFSVTNPRLITESQKYDAIRLMTRRLLSPDRKNTHHELLMFEALLALTNVASCLSATGAQERDFVNQIAKLDCGPKDKSSKLLSFLQYELLLHKNPRVQLAACELLSNLSLSESIVALAEELDEDFDSSSASAFSLTCQNMLAVLVAASEHFHVEEVLVPLQRAILGFFANLCSHAGVRSLFAKACQRKALSVVVPRTLETCQDAAIVHRVVFLADEYWQEESENIFAPLPADQVVMVRNVLKKHATEGGNDELRALCQQFVDLMEGNAML